TSSTTTATRSGAPPRGSSSTTSISSPTRRDRRARALRRLRPRARRHLGAGRRVRAVRLEPDRRALREVPAAAGAGVRRLRGARAPPRAPGRGAVTQGHQREEKPGPAPMTDARRDTLASRLLEGGASDLA